MCICMFSFKKGNEGDADLDLVLEFFEKFRENFMDRVEKLFFGKCFSDIETILDLPDTDARGFLCSIKKIAKEVTRINEDILHNSDVNFVIVRNSSSDLRSVSGIRKCRIQMLVAPFNEDFLMRQVNVISEMCVNVSNERANVLKKKLFDNKDDMLGLRNHIASVVFGKVDEYTEKCALTKNLTFLKCTERKDNSGCSIKNCIFKLVRAKFGLDVAVNCPSPECSNDIISQKIYVCCELKDDTYDMSLVVKFDREKVSGYADEEKIKLVEEYVCHGGPDESLAMPSAIQAAKESEKEGVQQLSI